MLASAIYAAIAVPVIFAIIIALEAIGLVLGILITSVRHLIQLIQKENGSTPSLPNRNVLVVALHGLGGSSRPLASRLGLVNYLRSYGFPNVVLFNYKSFVVSLQEAADQLDAFIDEQKRYFEAEHVLLVGISAGGRIALLSKHKSVCGVVPVLSPIRGSGPARLLQWLWPKVLFCPPIIRDLKYPADCSESPPHASVCGSLFCGFDGKVCLSEMTNSSTASSTTIHWMAHNFSQIDPLCHQGENYCMQPALRQRADT
jgi:pimeloyl-ACP methyl ester carboxylesterase